MNKEATFALRFVMKDFAKMRKAVEQMNKNLEQMKKNADKASTGMSKLNTSMGKTIRSISKFALAYFTLSKIMGSTFKKVNETIQIELMAQTAGVAARNIGKLGKALRTYGGDARSAGSAYASLTNIIGNAQHGLGVSEDVSRVNAMYGIGFNYGNISQDALMTEIAKRMHELRKEGDQWAINQIASAYGLDAPMASFLSEQGANWSSEANKQKWKELSKTETQKLIESQDELDRQLAELGNKLVPVINKAVDAILKLLKLLEERFGKNNPYRRSYDDKGNYNMVGKGNSSLQYNAKSGEYVVLDKNMEVIYQGKDRFRAHNTYRAENPTAVESWLKDNIFKPIGNWLGFGNKTTETKVDVVVTNKSPKEIDVKTKEQTLDYNIGGSSIQ